MLFHGKQAILCSPKKGWYRDNETFTPADSDLGLNLSKWLTKPFGYRRVLTQWHLMLTSSNQDYYFRNQTKFHASPISSSSKYENQHFHHIHLTLHLKMSNHTCFAQIDIGIASQNLCCSYQQKSLSRFSWSFRHFMVVFTYLSGNLQTSVY